MYLFIYYFQDQRALLVRIHVSCKFMEDLQWCQLSLQPWASYQVIDQLNQACNENSSIISFSKNGNWNKIWIKPKLGMILLYEERRMESFGHSFHVS